MTDDKRLDDPLAAARALPRGSVVILRSRYDGTRARLAAELKPLARARKLVLLAASDPKLAANADLDGLHLPEARLGEISHWRALRPRWFVTAAVHSLAALRRATRADAVLLAPVFPTDSHPRGTELTALRANLIARLSPVPVYALGGLGAANAKRLADGCFAGVAAISALSL